MRHLTLLASGLMAALLLAACGGSMSPSPLLPTTPIYTSAPPLSEMLSEKVLGSPGAPNTIIEYVSFWCPGCKQFHADVEPLVKSRFVDTGKAQLIFRNLFLNGETPRAAMVARCVGNAKFFEAADKIFSTQDTWKNSSDPDKALASVMLGFGMSQSLIDSCAPTDANALSSNALYQGLFKVHSDALAQTFQLPDGSTAQGFTHVPAIVVNGVKLDSTTDANGNVLNAPTIDNITKLVNK